MSEAPDTSATTETAAPLGDAATSLTATEGVRASSATGEGEGAAAPSGQGTGAEQTGQAGAPAGGETTAGGEGGETQSAPTSYDTFVVPEGYTLEGDMLDGVMAIAKAHGMSQEQAQGLVDLGVKQAQAVTAAFAEQASTSPVILAEHWAQQWSKQTLNDPEIGGKILADTMTVSRKAIATFGSPELAKFLGETGLAHHPELIRFMAKVGKAVSEDTLVTSQGGTGKENAGDAYQRAASKLYPSMQ